MTITGRADRIDEQTDGAIVLLDYKTGTAPSPQQVATHLEPQLTIEALMLAAGGFGAIGNHPIGDLAYVELKGSRDPVRLRSVLDNKEAKDAATLVAEVDERLRGLLERYAFASHGYLSRARVQLEKRLDRDYDHLARARERALAGEGGGPAPHTTRRARTPRRRSQRRRTKTQLPPAAAHVTAAAAVRRVAAVRRAAAARALPSPAPLPPR